MNWKEIGDNREPIQSSLKARWSRLTDEDLAGPGDLRARLVGRLQQIYGLTQHRAEAELRDWERHQDPIALVPAI